MSGEARFWLLIVALAVGTWLLRSLPILMHHMVETPPWLLRLLRHVPVAALTALAVPGTLYVRQGDANVIAPARTLAALVALAVASRSKSTLLTLLAGMAAFWIAQWAIGGF